MQKLTLLYGVGGAFLIVMLVTVWVGAALQRPVASARDAYFDLVVPREEPPPPVTNATPIFEMCCGPIVTDFKAGRALRVQAPRRLFPKSDPVPRILRERAQKAFDDYKELHRKIMDTKDTSVPKKFYVHGRCPWGLGNYQIRTIAGLVIAMLTNRAFISQDTQYDPYFKFPIPDMTLSDDELKARFGANSQDAIVVDHLAWDMCSDYEVNFSKNQSSGPKQFALSPRKFFGGMPWFAYIHPVHGDFMRRNFGRWFFYFFAKFLFSEVQDQEVIAFKAAEDERLYGFTANRDDQYRLGLQIRWGRGMDDFYLTDFQKDPEKYWLCADKLLAEQELQGKQGVIFLATDNMIIRNRTVLYFAARKPPIKVLHISAEARPEGEKHMALVDQLYLQEQDDLIVTQRSTFGFFPQAVGLHTPKVIHRIWDHCKAFPDSQVGMLVYGTYWPWGTHMCGGQKCCLEGMDQLVAYFGSLD
eukprot:TRINITY_DN19391_c0_g1_i1.p1 TRINITY_DN19391_c0_g1~~TRINITY_DN19391_c0_g1_i1.p1  ORF type:complete len:472 (-),score=107.37 TRINITY_DN19391_c0_g1_i1:161-1576(-)